VISARPGYEVSGFGGGIHFAGVRSRTSFIGCVVIRSSTSRRYSKGFFLCRRHDAIKLDRIAAALPPRSLWYRSQFFRLCGAPHNRNYAESVVMRSNPADLGRSPLAAHRRLAHKSA
jgi:hypothetical protein